MYYSVRRVRSTSGKAGLRWSVGIGQRSWRAEKNGRREDGRGRGKGREGREEESQQCGRIKEEGFNETERTNDNSCGTTHVSDAWSSGLRSLTYEYPHPGSSEQQLASFELCDSKS